MKNEAVGGVCQAADCVQHSAFDTLLSVDGVRLSVDS